MRRRPPSPQGPLATARRQPAGPGWTRPRRRTRPGVGCERRLVGEGDVEGVPVDRPQLRRASARSASSAFAYSSERRDVGDRRVVGDQGDRHARAGAAAPADGRRATATMPACQFEVGQRSSVTPRADSSAQSAGSSIAPGPWAIRSGSIASARRTCAAPPHSPAWSVIRRPPARAASNARGVEQRVREAPPRAGEVPAGQAAGRGSGRAVSARLDVGRRVVRAQRGADEPDDRARSAPRAAAAPAHDRRDPVGERQAAGDVEQRPPADLDVADAVGRLGLDQLGA